MASSNPALKQLWLLPLAVIPGLLAYLRILTPNQAGLCIVALYLVSRWHASKIQRDFDARNSSASSSPSVASASLSLSSSSKSRKQKPSKKSA